RVGVGPSEIGNGRWGRNVRRQGRPSSTAYPPTTMNLASVEARQSATRLPRLLPSTAGGVAGCTERAHDRFGDGLRRPVVFREIVRRDAVREGGVGAR